MGEQGYCRLCHEHEELAGGVWGCKNPRCPNERIAPTPQPDDDPFAKAFNAQNDVIDKLVEIETERQKQLTYCVIAVCVVLLFIAVLVITVIQLRQDVDGLLDATTPTQQEATDERQ